MSKHSLHFEQENALLFARLEELSGKVEEQIAKVKVYEQKIIGLEFELKKLSQEREQLKRQTSFLKKENERVSSKAKVLDVLENENFSIKNKITKIVSEIDSQEVSEEAVKDLMQTLIGEIDDCIRLLQNK
jgi:chromosome segregation ATPase